MLAGLGFTGDGVHHGDRLDRVQSGGGLGRQHHGVRAVVDGVGHVRRLGARGARQADHALEHLRGGDHGLARLAAHADDAFLDGRHLLGAHLDAQVTARDHDAVHFLQDVLEAVHGLRLLDFRHQLGAAAETGHVVPGQQQVVTGAHEAQRHPVHTQFRAEFHVLHVLLGQGGHAQVSLGHVDALVVLQDAADHDGGQHVVAAHALDAQGHVAVVEQQGHAGRHVVNQGLVGRADAGGVALDVVHGDGELVTGRQGDAALREAAHADLGPLKVLQDADGDALLGGQFTDHLQGLAVVFTVAVAEVHADDVQARVDHAAQDFRAAAGGADGRHDLGGAVNLFHVESFPIT